jgi:hypothetical protein
MSTTGLKLASVAESGAMEDCRLPACSSACPSLRGDR